MLRSGSASRVAGRACSSITPFHRTAAPWLKTGRSVSTSLVKVSERHVLTATRRSEFGRAGRSALTATTAPICSRTSRELHTRPSTRQLSTMHKVGSMPAADLAAIVRDKAQAPGRDYLIVDVRDDDFAGGNIPGAFHVPSHTLSEPAVVENCMTRFRAVPKLIFHCALSQQRGPKAAMMFSRLLVDENAHVQVYVLPGGFSQWQAKYKDDPDLLENYNKKMWQDEWWH